MEDFFDTPLSNFLCLRVAYRREVFVMDINTLCWKDNTLRVNYLSGKTLEVSPVSFFEYMYLSDIHSSNDVEFLNTFFKKRTCKIV